MFAGITFSTVILVAFFYFIFRKPVKTITEQANKQLPKIIAAAADAASVSAVSAAFAHRKETDAEMQDQYGVSISEIEAYYEALANNKPKRNNP